ncbi:MAG: TetR/AcrR family transcriptional regulator [Candidatus Marinarcus sp.]|uniref:TetR/AcrR family transcriptional regulator n=1 Tax=Candidatus Marinarcus sp. TaxID=3100987 RepID=UPI003B008D21
MKKIIDEINKVKKELYLKESAKYIDEVGYKNFKISQLAKQLETSVGTIYNLFNSKEDLYLEYLILKLELFSQRLNTTETNIPMNNLKLYLRCKYEIFIEIDKNSPMTSDPYFFHKLDIANHPIVLDIYEFLTRQFEQICPHTKMSHMHLAILFKKLSDGFIESYLLKKYDTTNIIDDTIKQFFEGIA